VIRAIDGHPVNDLVTAAKRLYARKKGESVTLSLYMQRARGFLVQRGTREVEVKVR